MQCLKAMEKVDEGKDKLRQEVYFVPKKTKASGSPDDRVPCTSTR